MRSIVAQIAAALEAFRSIRPFQPLLVSWINYASVSGLQGDLDTQPRIRTGAVFEVDLIRILSNSWQRRSQSPLTIHLAELACWLVGHPQATRPGDRVPKFSPVPELTLEQNQVIKAVLEESDWECHTPSRGFIQRLTGCPFDVPLTFRLKPSESRLSLVPDWDQGAWKGGKRFRLTHVRDGETRLITVTGDDRVTIGRSSDCDFVATSSAKPDERLQDAPDQPLITRISAGFPNPALSFGIAAAKRIHRSTEGLSKGQVSISPLDQCRLTMAEDYHARVKSFPSAFRIPIEIAADVTAIESRNAPDWCRRDHPGF